MEKDCTKVVHSKRVEKMKKYTPNEWGRWKNTLKTGVVQEIRDLDAMVKKIIDLPTSIEMKQVTVKTGEKIHSKGVGKTRKYTRNE